MSRNNISPLIKAQLEKLNAAGGGGGGITSGRRIISSSSPIVIPNKLPYSNPSSQGSSSYRSVGDQMSSIGETLLQSHNDTDDGLCTSLPLLSSTHQQLVHSAARDRIAVKNKLRRPIKQKLSALKEIDDRQIDLFSSISTYEQTNSLPQIESKKPSQSIIDVPDLNIMQLRVRDHSADKILSTSPIIPTYISSMRRSTSFKHPQEMKLINQSLFVTPPNHKDEEDEEEINENKSISSYSSEEHIYDNLDLYKRHKTPSTSDIVSDENQSSTNIIVTTREHSTLTTARLRPVTVHITSNNDQQTVNEFENVFNQLKKRSLMKNVLPKEEIIPEPSSSERIEIPVLINSTGEETPTPLIIENESIVPNMMPMTKRIEISHLTQQPNRRKTVGGVHLPGNNKVATTDNKPAASWIDIAKQKQSKFQSISNEKHQHDEPEQQEVIFHESPVISRKQVNISSNLTIVKENTSEDVRLNRKSMFEPAITRRASPTVPLTNTVERDSIRALKADKPNRINNLIQFFDK
ncbi:unnamed protein product [Adineta steineri]|uniref:Uncharacterized protein n=1 Tax=Adineta steineri TaxID=433720 RepID=A0A815U7U9_9BILA|nr:unnamed protein product [Adineta steineri]CAF4030797.1 unnamed protein product [Adineta steineri]